MELTGKQRRFLRSQAHSLKPVVQVGRNGVSEALQGEVERALQDHELIKIKGPAGPKDQVTGIASSLAADLEAHLIQIVGGVITLFKSAETGSRYKLPTVTEPGSSQVSG